MIRQDTRATRAVEIGDVIAIDDLTDATVYRIIDGGDAGAVILARDYDGGDYRLTPRSGDLMRCVVLRPLPS